MENVSPKVVEDLLRSVVALNTAVTELLTSDPAPTLLPWPTPAAAAEEVKQILESSGGSEPDNSAEHHGDAQQRDADESSSEVSPIPQVPLEAEASEEPPFTAEHVQTYMQDRYMMVVEKEGQDAAEKFYSEAKATLAENFNAQTVADLSADDLATFMQCMETR